MRSATPRPQDPVDGYRPPWTSFADFFEERRDVDSRYLTELQHGLGTRRHWTVGEWREKVARVTTGLAGRGIGPGSVVATLAGNTADGLALAHACWVMSACVLPLNPGDQDSRQAFILRDARAAFIVHSAEHEQTARRLSALSSVETHAAGLLFGGSRQEAPRSVGLAGDGGLDLPALRIYTSGTTGDPKAVSLTARNLLVHTDGLSRGLAWTEADRVLTVLPIHHVNGLLISCLLPWHIGASTVLCDRFRSELFWHDVAAEGVTVCSVVPTLLEFLLAGGGTRPDRFRQVLCGAGPLLPETVVGFEDRFAVPVRHLYGLSETTAVATLMPEIADDDRRRWYTELGFPSIGRPLPHVGVTVLDDDGNEVGAGTRGQLAVRGATVMSGYADSPGATAQSFAGGWFLTGDEGFWERNGDDRFFFVTGRRKELIIRGGVNFSPLEIDAVLNQHPGVNFGLTIAFENRFYGDEIAAYVVPEGDVTEDDIRTHCIERLGFPRSPKVVLFGTEVPYTATGKAKRLELARRLAGDLAPYRDVQFRMP